MADEEKNNNPLEIFELAGWELADAGSQMVCECPFCGKNKMYVDKKRTTFSCKVCGASGNSATVLKTMFEKVWQPAMTYTDYSIICAARARKSDKKQLPQEAYELETHLGKFDDKYIWLVQKPNGNGLGLRTWLPRLIHGERQAVRNLKGCPLGFLGGELLPSADGPIYICEGEWDRIAFNWLLYKTEEPGCAIAVPGASNLPKPFLDAFIGKDVVGLYDNDNPGKAGSAKCYSTLKGRCKSLKFLHWTADKPDKYDIDDLAKDHSDNPEKAFEYVLSNLKDIPTGEVTSQVSGILSTTRDREKEQADIKPIGVDELHRVYRKWLILDNCDLLDIAMACCWSIHLPGNPLWLFIVAPPSGSKSETIMPLSEFHRVHAVSNMTSKSLISGFQGAPGMPDPSLLYSLQGKKAVLAIKDLTPLLQGREDERDEVFGILRDAYDGAISKVFGNGTVRAYKDLHFSIIAGVTSAIDIASHTALGERFIKFRSDRDTDRASDKERTFRAIKNSGSEEKMKEELRAASVQALMRPFDPKNVLEPSESFSTWIVNISILVAHMRAVAPTERGSDVQLMSPMVEAPPRLGTQFIKLAKACALHYEATTLEDPRIKNLVSRCALHTADTISVKVVQCLFLYHRMPMTRNSISDMLRELSSETIYKCLIRYSRIGVILQIKQDGGSPLFKLTEYFYNMVKDTGVFDNLPRTDVYWRERFYKVKTASGKMRIVFRKPV